MTKSTEEYERTFKVKQKEEVEYAQKMLNFAPITCTKTTRSNYLDFNQPEKSVKASENVRGEAKNKRQRARQTEKRQSNKIA